MRSLSILLAGILLIASLKLNAQAICNRELTGHVEDGDTEELLAGAVVKIVETGMIAITDGKGDFFFKQLCPGKYTIIVTHVGCDSASQHIELQNSLHLDLHLHHAVSVLGEVEVQARRPMANAGYKKPLAASQLEQTRGLGFAEAVAKINGITLLQTGATIAKPVVHGLHGIRILTIANGVRQEGQQWGNEHATEIDPFMAENIVLVKGVDELQFGSDAIGGVIIVDPKPIRNQPGSDATLNLGYYTNNRQWVSSALWQQQCKRIKALAYRVQASLVQGSSIATPTYVLNNTAAGQQSFSATARFKTDKINSEAYYSYFFSRQGIFSGSHIGNITNLLEAIGQNMPDAVFIGRRSYEIRRPRQQVLHQMAKWDGKWKLGKQQIQWLLAFQHNQRREYDIVRNPANTRPQLSLTINTFAEQLNWEPVKKQHSQLKTGLAFTQQLNGYSGRYLIPQFSSYTQGAFLIQKWKLHNWEIHGGLRFDVKTIRTHRYRLNGDTIAHRFRFTTGAGNVNVIYKIANRFAANILLGYNSRAPYVNELLSDGIHHGSATYEKGTHDLKVEQVWQFASGLKYSDPLNLISVDLLLYRQQFRNFIYLVPVPASPVLTTAGAFPLMQYQQVHAQLQGADLSIAVQLAKPLRWQTKWMGLYAKDLTHKSWLIMMPPNRFVNEAKVEFETKKFIEHWDVSLESQYTARQTRVPYKDNQPVDYALPPGSNHLITLHTNARFTCMRHPCKLGLSVFNLTNIQYRNYLNTQRYFADEMGRNISIRFSTNL